MGATYLAKNAGSQHQRTKHIDIRHHFLRELITEGIAELLHHPTDQMPADALTKDLGKVKFAAITKMFMNSD